MDNRKILKIVKYYLIPLLAVPLVLIGIYVTYLKIQNYHDTRNKVALTTLNGISSVFETTNRSVSEVLLTYSGVGVFQKDVLTEDDRKEIRTLIYGYCKNSNLQDISFGSVQGEMFTPNEPLLPEGYDPRVRPWYIDATKTLDEGIVSTSYRDAKDSNKWALSYSLQVINQDGELTGVLGTDLKIEGVDAYFNKYFNQFKGRVIVLDEHNNIIIEKENDKFLMSNKKGIAENFLRKDGLNTLIQYEGKKYRMDKSTIPKMNWTVVLLTPSYEVFEALLGLLVPMFSIFLMAFVLMEIFFMKIKASLIKPLESVSKQIDEINVDEIQENLSFDFSIPFELHVIKDTINRMLERITTQYEEIETLYEKTSAMNDSLTELVDEIQENYRSTIYALSSAIEANDAYTKGHCDRVKEYALKLGRKLRLSKSELQILEYAAILHDIGKVGIPSDILHKPGKLTPEEYEIICKHPTVGVEILKDIPYLNTIRTIIEQHHERVDGRGYPKKLREEEIHPFAQILCITDSFDAMTTERPYRIDKMSNIEAIEELKRCSGSQFSAKKVNIFIEILQEENID